MNWNGAKNIIIILFISINLGLLAINVNIIPGGKLKSQTLKNTALVLRERNIDVRCPIPAQIPRLAPFRINTSDTMGTSNKNDTEKEKNSFQTRFILQNEIAREAAAEIEEKRLVMPANHVLLKNFTFNPIKQTIVDIKAGYVQKINKTKNNEEQFIPVWCIMLNDGDIKYFKAFTGEEIIV